MEPEVDSFLLNLIINKIYWVLTE